MAKWPLRYGSGVATAIESFALILTGEDVLSALEKANEKAGPYRAHFSYEDPSDCLIDGYLDLNEVALILSRLVDDRPRRKKETTFSR